MVFVIRIRLRRLYWSLTGCTDHQCFHGHVKSLQSGKCSKLHIRLEISALTFFLIPDEPFPFSFTNSSTCTPPVHNHPTNQQSHFRFLVYAGALHACQLSIAPTNSSQIRFWKVASAPTSDMLRFLSELRWSDRLFGLRGQRKLHFCAWFWETSHQLCGRATSPVSPRRPAPESPRVTMDLNRWVWTVGNKKKKPLPVQLLFLQVL